MFYYLRILTFLVFPQQHHLWFVNGWLHQCGPHIRNTDVIGRTTHRVLQRDKTHWFTSGSLQSIQKIYILNRI